MKQLKQKTIKSLLPIIIMFWAFTAFAASYAIPGLYTYYFVDPIPLESVDFEEDIEGLYVSGQIYGIYDWYCEEREDSRITAREYLIDANDVYYMCLLADNDSEMDDANKLTDASYAYLSYEDDGTLLMEAQYEVRGVIKPIPYDSLKFLHEYLDWDNLEEDVKAQFLPYYLDVNNLGAIEYDSACIAGILGIIFFMVGLIFLILALTGRYQKSVKKYISASASPDLARERVDYFILNNKEINGLRYNRDFICGHQGPSTVFGEMSKLAWVYLHTTVHKRYFITVSKSHSLMLGFTDGTRQAVNVKNEKIAQDHMQQLSLLCPHVVFGYTDDLDRMFRKDLNGFLNLRYHTPQEEQTSCFDVELSSPGPEKIQVIKVIREVTGLGLKEAKDLVDVTPSIVKKGVSKQEAEDIMKQLEALGATVTLK